MPKAATEGAFAITVLLFESSEPLSNTPRAPLIGVHAATFLGTEATNLIHGSLDGITAVDTLQGRAPTSNGNETFALLERFGQLLSVDVMDVLNRSTNRAETLTAYLKELTDTTTQAEQRKELIEGEVDALNDVRREQNRTVTTLERDGRNALRNNEFEKAGRNQQDLQTARTNLETTEAKIDEREEIITLFERLIPVAKERIDAIDKNREVLIAGLKVVDVPGIEDLGLIQDTRTTRTSTFR